VAGGTSAITAGAPNAKAANSIVLMIRISHL
jgi:hypothetical protein